jgi:hypothetical protein
MTKNIAFTGNEKCKPSLLSVNLPQFVQWNTAARYPIIALSAIATSSMRACITEA